jgi:hypothetical protein
MIDTGCFVHTGWGETKKGSLECFATNTAAKAKAA